MKRCQCWGCGWGLKDELKDPDDAACIRLALRMEFSPGEDFLVSCTAAALILGADAFTPKAVCMLMHSFAMCGWLPGPALMREVEQLAIRRCKDFR